MNRMGQGMQVNDSAWLSNLLPGGSDHNYVPRGYCYDEGEFVFIYYVSSDVK